ncbi:hypothetical protein LRP88_04118 [Fusarium phalaenopsidis]
MSTENNASTRKVYLETFNDWGNWDKAFKLKANSARIWQLVNPDTSDQPMPRPIRPLVSTYYRRIPPQRVELERPLQTRGSSQTLAPTYTPESTDPTQQAQHISELTAEDKASFQSERKDYDQDYREFEQEQSRIDKMKDWMMETVATGLITSAFDPEQDLRSWYINLRDSVGATTTEQQVEARAKYQKTLASMPKAAKDFPRWLTDWEQATHQAQAKGIGGLDNPNVWFDDLCKVIQPSYGNWVSIYHGIYQDKLEAKTLSIRDVAKNLRAEVSRKGLLQPTKTAPARVKRGAFGPTYGQDPDPTDQSDQEQDLGQEGQQPARSSGSAGPSQPKRTSKKRKSEQPVSQSKRTKSKQVRDQGNTNSSCEACGGLYHGLSDCYYLFPSKAPAWFEENPVIRDGVKYRLSNQGLKDKVKALKELPRLAESD